MIRLSLDSRVVDAHLNYLIRGPRPTSVADMRRLQVNTIVNLEEGLFERFHEKNFREDRWAEQLGVSVAHLHLSGIRPPTAQEVVRFTRMVDNGLNNGSVYFHCLGGDRTGYMAAAYRVVVQGWGPDRAIDEMLALGFHRVRYYHWIQSLRRLR